MLVNLAQSEIDGFRLSQNPVRVPSDSHHPRSAQEHRRGIQDTPNPTLDFDFWADFGSPFACLSQRAEVDLHQMPVPAAQFVHNPSPRVFFRWTSAEDKAREWLHPSLILHQTALANPTTDTRTAPKFNSVGKVASRKKRLRRDYSAKFE